MNPMRHVLVIGVVILILLAGCGGSETDQAAQGTQVALAVGATLTAGAPPATRPVVTVVVTPVPPAATEAVPAEPAAGPTAPERPAPLPTQPPSGSTPTEPPATLTPGGQEPAVISLQPGGGGDYASLAEAIRNAPPGAQISLEAGLYPLDQAMTVDRPLSLLGAGGGQTVIMSEAAEHLLRFEGPGPFVAEGITFRHDGTQPANVVVVLGGEVSFSFCTFTGGVFSAETGYGGNGLFLGGETTGSVYQCEATRNQELGILLREQAQPSISLSYVHHNGGCGIGYFGQAAGYAGANNTSHNGLNGICLSDVASPVLDENVCRHNEYSGIVYYGQSGGEARGNDCSLNSQDGIAVQGQAQPLLEANNCFANSEIDIAYFDTSGGTARANRCSIDAPYGLYVVETAHPTLIANQCPLAGAAVQDGGGSAPRPRYNPDSLEGFGPTCFNRPPPAIEHEWQTSAGNRSAIIGDSVPLSLRNKWGEPGESYEVTVRVITPDANEASALIRLDGDLEAVVVYPDDFDGGSTDARGAYTVIWEIDGGPVACDGFVTTGGAS